MKYYAVHRGRIPGVYTTWEECSAQVHKYPKHLHQSFQTKHEAEYFVKFGVEKGTTPPKKITSYFKTILHLSLPQDVEGEATVWAERK